MSDEEPMGDEAAGAPAVEAGEPEDLGEAEELSEADLEKADPELRRVLEWREGGPQEGGRRGGAQRRVRIVVLLRSTVEEARRAEGGAGGEGDRGDDAPRPSEYADRVSWRRALLEHRQRRVAADLGPARHELEEAGLELRGGTTSAAVVADGSLAAVRRALTLHCVRRATLDRPVRVHPAVGRSP